ncbi:MAG: DapH/DapD/GlmU-related protein [Vibrio cyclitrophicus]
MMIYNIINNIISKVYSSRFKSFGIESRFFPLGSHFSFNYISIGNNVYIGPGAWFSSGKGAELKIGNDVLIGPRVTILTGDHEVRQVGVKIRNALKTDASSSEVIIHNDVWVGANVTILKGVTIGKGSVVAAGSVVTRSVDDFTIVAGVPAKKVKERFSENELKEHLSIIKYD